MNNETEVWKDIPDYEGYYQVSNFGRVKSMGRVNEYGRRKTYPAMIMNTRGRNGYQSLVLAKRDIGKKGIGKLIHRLVALAFIPNPENKPQVNHKDGNKSNNHVDNLEWCTASENIVHAHKTGLSSVSHLIKFSKGNDPHNKKILIDTQTGIFYNSITEAAKLYELDRMTLRHYLSGKWPNKTSLRYA